ncbi:hypothetical protein D9M68_746190 [compost metagenome]
MIVSSPSVVSTVVPAVNTPFATTAVLLTVRPASPSGVVTEKLPVCVSAATSGDEPSERFFS